MIYVYSFTWSRYDHIHFETHVTRRHPLLVLKDWHEQYDGNNGTKLLWYHGVSGEELGDIELQDYLDYCLDENLGELHGGPEK